MWSCAGVPNAYICPQKFYTLNFPFSHLMCNVYTYNLNNCCVKKYKMLYIERHVLFMYINEHMSYIIMYNIYNTCIDSRENSI